MNNPFVDELLIKLDMKYDNINYDLGNNFLEIVVDKTICFKDLGEIMGDLSVEIPYQLIGFKSDGTSYVFTYQLKVE